MGNERGNACALPARARKSFAREGRQPCKGAMLQARRAWHA